MTQMWTTLLAAGVRAVRLTSTVRSVCFSRAREVVLAVPVLVFRLHDAVVSGGARGLPCDVGQPAELAPLQGRRGRPLRLAHHRPALLLLETSVLL